MKVMLREGDSLGLQYLVVHLVQGGAVRHVKSPQQRAPLLLDLLRLQGEEEEEGCV